MSAIKYDLGSDQILTLTIDMPGQSANTMNGEFRAALTETANKVKGDLDRDKGNHHRLRQENLFRRRRPERTAQSHP